MKMRLFPWIVPIGFAAWMTFASLPPGAPENEPRIHEFGSIPVVYNGRVKPMDTLARNVLKIITGKETFSDEEGRRRPAVQWLLEVLVAADDAGHRARSRRVFRILHPQLLHELGLSPRPGYRYAVGEFDQRLSSLARNAAKARAREKARIPLDAYERQLIDLEHRWSYYDALARRSIPHVIPPAGTGGTWSTLPEAGPRGKAFRELLAAYAENRIDAFNAAVAAHLERLEADRPSTRTRARFESLFNHANPFGKCCILYLAGIVLSFLAWLGWSKPLNRSVFILLWLAFMVHTLALVARMYLSERPPVTNLYSSAVFVGWGCVLMGLIFERIYRLGIGNIISALAGAATLLIALALAAEGDTMAVLQAVLDTQFWLATHVTSITLGYSATYVAGLIGLIFILRGALTRTLTPALRETLGRMIYGSISFGIFFSLTGTILGGLWADDSWGRFWGWDPKENGALMVVLWNALILHAWRGHMVRERGLATLAVFGNIMVSWAWFGVNQLNVGLHTYGFTSGTTLWLILFVISQMMIVFVGMFPKLFPLREAHAEGR